MRDPSDATPRLTSRRPSLRGETGSALVEFALMSVVFFVVVFGTMDVGRMIFDYNIISSVARDGVRWASVRGASSGRVATATDVKTYVISRSLGLLTAADITVTWPDSGGNISGNRVQVQTQYTFNSSLPMLPDVTTLVSTSELEISR